MSETIEAEGITYDIVFPHYGDVFFREFHEDGNDFDALKMPKEVALKFAKAIIKEYEETVTEN
jgi:hypothetical protein